MDSEILAEGILERTAQMMKRAAIWLIDRLFVKAYAQTLQAQADKSIEAIKLEFLEKGIERGRASMRHGTCFDLYLQRADPATTDDGYLRAAQISMGVAMPAPGVKVWAWWLVYDEAGKELCLGSADKMTVHQALERALELLPAETRAVLGDTK